MKQLPPLLALLIALLWQPGPAQAHLMAPNHATVHLVGASAYSVVWLPASVLKGVPRDAAGRVAQADIERVQAAVVRDLQDRFTLRDGATLARTARLDLILQPPDSTPDGRADQLVMLHHAIFPQPPLHIELSTDLFGDAAGAHLTVSASGDRGAEQVDLSPLRAQHVFFAAAPRPARRSALLIFAALAVALAVALAGLRLCNRRLAAKV